MSGQGLLVSALHGLHRTPIMKRSSQKSKARYLKSMVATPDGRMISSMAGGFETQAKKRTYRRNVARRKKKALERAEKALAMESKIHDTPVKNEFDKIAKDKGKVVTKPLQREQEEEVKTIVSGLPEYTPTSPCQGCNDCDGYRSPTHFKENENMNPCGGCPGGMPQGHPQGTFIECHSCNVLFLQSYKILEYYIASTSTDKKNKEQEIEPYIPRHMDYAPRSDDHQREIRRMKKVQRKTFDYQVKIGGKRVNLIEGLELHTDVFSKEDQKEILDCVFRLRDLGRAGRLREKTYSEPEKWMRGKGRITIQCGCCYNFALKDSVPPGILQHDQVDPMPAVLKKMIKRMVRWRVLPVNCIPNSFIINIYDRGDCIPPHIDHHDFVRPFSTVSFLTECDILFGKEITILGPGEFQGSFKIPLPIGSVLVLQGNGADLAKHCIPGVPTRRVSVTFRRMDPEKTPCWFKPDPELEELRPLEL